MSEREHKRLMEELYKNIKFRDAIDCWASYHARDELDVRISNARHLDPVRIKKENRIWREIIKPDDWVLDSGCGRGFFSRRVRDLFGGKVNIIGLDISEEIVRIGHHENPDLLLFAGNAETLPFPDNYFNVVLTISMVEHLKDVKSVVKELSRVIKPGGYLYICIHKPWCDLLVLPSILRIFLSLYRWLIGKKRTIKKRAGYTAPFGMVRQGLKEGLESNDFRFYKKDAILHTFEWTIYKKLFPFFIPFLIKLGAQLNRLPLTYYKDLEYWVYKKI